MTKIHSPYSTNVDESWRRDDLQSGTGLPVEMRSDRSVRNGAVRRDARAWPEAAAFAPRSWQHDSMART